MATHHDERGYVCSNCYAGRTLKAKLSRAAIKADREASARKLDQEAAAARAWADRQLHLEGSDEGP